MALGLAFSKLLSHLLNASYIKLQFMPSLLSKAYGVKTLLLLLFYSPLERMRGSLMGTVL